MNSLYSSESCSFDKLKKRIKIPPFQRNVVWSEEKKQNFIDTVLKGLPFGSLLIYIESPMDYLLVDGLQRYTTLEDFEKNPCKYINLESQCKNSLNKLLNSLKKVIRTNYGEFKAELTNTIKQNINFNLKENIICENIINQFPIIKEDTDCYCALHDLIYELKDGLDVSHIDIPLICFKGNFDDLPEIFERMNANGTQLTKYEIYAAKWCTTQFDYHDPIILQLIDEKYQNMIDKTGVEIHNYQEGQVIKEQKINLFEFCFAFGKLLKQNNSRIIFDKSEFNKSDVSSIGFTLLTVILVGSLNHMDTISKYFQDMTPQKTKNLINLKDKILNCANSVEHLLLQYTMMIDGKTNVTKYIENQIISIIATLFKIRYTVSLADFSVTENPNTGKLNKAFQANMPFRYLYDILSGYWSGSGDSKISEELSKDLSNNRYLNEISSQSWEQLLYDWMTEQTQKPKKNISTENKLFLNYLFRMNKTNNKYLNFNKPLNYEYIVKKDRFQKAFKDGNGLSAVGNICIFPQYETHSKQEYTVYESIDMRLTLYTIDEEGLQDFLYPERSELAFTRADLTYKNYLKFITDRHQYLINTFLKYINTMNR